VFQEYTLNDGTVRLDFGDGVYGSILPPGQFNINYVLVQVSDYDAAQDLNPVPVNSVVTCPAFNIISGLTLGALSPIQPEKAPDFYQRNASFIGSGQKQGNTRDNLTALALAYPGVLDARLLGQAEINPSDLRWMNGIACCLLTTTTWGNADFNQFVAYMQKLSDSTRHFYRYDPTPVQLPFTIYGEVAQRANIDDTKQKMVDTLKTMLTLKEGSLGARYANAMTGKLLVDGAQDPYGRLVTYIEIKEPVLNPVLKPTQYAVLKGTPDINLVYDPTLTPKIVSGVTVPGGRIGISG
jgi:hypothetical protein